MKDRILFSTVLSPMAVRHDSVEFVEEFAFDTAYYEASTYYTVPRQEAELPALTAYLHDLGEQEIN